MKGAAALAVLLLAAGCSTRPAPVPPPKAPQVAVTPAPGLIMSPRAYVTASSSFELFVAGAAGLAASRARDPRLRAHNSDELADHRGLSAQLSFAGRGLNLLPPRAMWKADSQRIAEMAVSADFDNLYKQRMIVAHEYHLKLNRDVAERGPSPTLRPVARNAAGILARHLVQLRAL